MTDMKIKIKCLSVIYRNFLVRNLSPSLSDLGEGERERQVTYYCHRQFRIVKIFLLVILLLSPALAHSGGLQVSPVKLEFKLALDQTQSQTLVVINPTADVQLFEIYLDEVQPGLKLAPESFTLEAGARRDVTVTADGGKFESDLTLATLSLVSRPLSDSRVNVGAGAKIPITIRLGGRGGQDWLVLGLTLTLSGAALAFGVWKNFARKT